ncbi:hypothetical protein D3C72_2073320 [compost metagenome]
MAITTNPMAQTAISWPSMAPSTGVMQAMPQPGSCSRACRLPWIVTHTSRLSRLTLIKDLRNSTRLLMEKIFLAPSTGLIFLISGLIDSPLSRNPYWAT